MNRTRISLTAALLSLCLLLSGCMMPPAEGTVTSFSLEAIPAWSGEPYVAVDGNQPDFPEEDMTSVSFETYSELDTLGRCGVAYANVGQDLMPTEDRESISSVTPSGWINREYDGEYLYNRCHLIGFQLTGENANEENLITGTRYMNVDGMLPFENLVADYVKETDNHVLYRVTPVFEGQNLVASGVQMEAWSVEDEGEGVCFNVYVYNVQPGITIDYATGESWQEGAAKRRDHVHPQYQQPQISRPGLFQRVRHEHRQPAGVYRQPGGSDRPGLYALRPMQPISRSRPGIRPRAAFSNVQQQQFTGRTQSAVIWGGQLRVMAPLNSMQTCWPTRKQQALSVWTRTCWQFSWSQTHSSQGQTRRTVAHMVTALEVLSISIASSTRDTLHSIPGGGKGAGAGSRRGCAFLPDVVE